MHTGPGVHVELCYS